MDYHRFETQHKASVLRMWKVPDISQEDKTAIDQFLKYCKSEGLGWARLRKLCQVLMALCRRHGKEQCIECYIEMIKKS